MDRERGGRRAAKAQAQEALAGVRRRREPRLQLGGARDRRGARRLGGVGAREGREDLGFQVVLEGCHRCVALGLLMGQPRCGTRLQSAEANYISP